MPIPVLLLPALRLPLTTRTRVRTLRLGDRGDAVAALHRTFEILTLPIDPEEPTLGL